MELILLRPPLLELTLGTFTAILMALTPMLRQTNLFPFYVFRLLQSATLRPVAAQEQPVSVAGHLPNRQLSTRL